MVWVRGNVGLRVGGVKELVPGMAWYNGGDCLRGYEWNTRI